MKWLKWKYFQSSLQGLQKWKFFPLVKPWLLRIDRGRSHEHSIEQQSWLQIKSCYWLRQPKSGGYGKLFKHIALFPERRGTTSLKSGQTWGLGEARKSISDSWLGSITFCSCFLTAGFREGLPDVNVDMTGVSILFLKYPSWIKARNRRIPRGDQMYVEQLEHRMSGVETCLAGACVSRTL